MPGGRPSRWKAGHVRCQAAVDNVAADLTKEIDQRNARIIIEIAPGDCLLELAEEWSSAEARRLPEF